MWPFSKTEKRESSFTDELVRQIVTRAGGATLARPRATSALEASAGLVGRAFAAASVEAPDPIRAALTPQTRALMGRELIRRGEIVFQIVVSMEGTLRLDAAADWDVRGPASPEAWMYRLNMPGPSGQRTAVSVPAAGVVHLRYSVDPERPWRGQGPLDHASLAGRLNAALQGALGDEASGPRGHLLPLPQVEGTDDVKAGIRNLNGHILTVESTSDAWQGDGPMSAPKKDWETVRLGADPPQALVQLLELADRQIFEACGVSPQLFAKEGSAAREAWRQVLFGLIAPLGAIVSEELSSKLDAAVKLDWEELRASDVQGRARAFQSMVGGGMEVERAAALSGLMVADDD